MAYLSSARAAAKTTKLSRKASKLTELAAVIRATDPAGDQVAFLHSAFCKVGLPRSRPEGDAFQRQSGSAVIRLEAGELWNGETYIKPGLPYGTKPRLLLLHLIRSYLRTDNRTITLGGSMRDFLTNELFVDASGGANGGMTAFKQHALALASCRLTIGYLLPTGARKAKPTDRWISAFDMRPEEDAVHGRCVPWPGSITLTQEFAASIRESAVPLDARALRGIQDSALSLDIYAWLAQRLHRLERPTTLYWANARHQFAQEYSNNKAFKRNFVKSLKDVLTVYPQAKVERVFGGFKLIPSPPPVPPKVLTNFI
ncbi:replication protein RepA [Lysobacter sp. CA196]|uniref:replication protein RepA n=1 Tax=Lysobacter sp. CA196 TaxID=3455606 RepID=UPI003F8CF51D